MERSGFRALVAQAQTGDSQATADFVAAVRPQVEAGVRRLAGPAHADQSYHDWVNDVWARLLKTLGQFRGTQAQNDEEAWKRFCTWLRRIIRTVLANAQRHRQRHEPPRPRKKVRLDPIGLDSSTGQAASAALLAKDPSPSAHAAKREELRLLGAALEDLSAADRALLTRHFLENHSWEQIAADLGRTVHQVKYRYQLIQERLRQSLGRQP